MYFKSEKNHITKLNQICQPTDMIKTEKILFYIFSIGIKKVFGNTNQSEHSNNLMSAIMTNSIITDM